MLTADKYKWVLFTPCLAAPTAESFNEQLLEYEKWKQYDEIAKCYILGSMSNVLQEKHHLIKTTIEIMTSVDKMFVGLDRHARFKATSAFMNLHEKKGQMVHEHMMKVIAYLSELEILGAKIDTETKNCMVLKTLSDTFAQFKIDYELNKKDYTLAALMNYL